MMINEICHGRKTDMGKLKEGTIVRQARTPLGMMKIHMEPISYQTMQKYRGGVQDRWYQIPIRNNSMG